MKDDDGRSGKIVWIEMGAPTAGKRLRDEDIASVGA